MNPAAMTANDLLTGLPVFLGAVMGVVLQANKQGTNIQPTLK